jgi:hypothetical protein
LVERGKPIQNQQKEIEFLHSSPTIRFSSTLIEFEVIDLGLKNRKGSLFFSFAHERNQVIGYKNFAQLEQLSIRDKIKIRLRMKEHKLHSAIMFHLSSNFQ